MDWLELLIPPPPFVGMCIPNSDRADHVQCTRCGATWYRTCSVSRCESGHYHRWMQHLDDCARTIQSAWRRRRNRPNA